MATKLTISPDQVRRERNLAKDARSGNTFYVDAGFADASDENDGKGWASALATVQKAEDLATAGDEILVAADSTGYDELVTIAKAGITIRGAGPRGSVFVQATANGVAITVAGVDDVTLDNIGCEGNGTGAGLHLQGDVDRFRATGCKIEGGAVAAKLESTAAGAVADTRFVDCEFAWSTDGVNFLTSGGGDPVTQTLFLDCLFHNLTTAGIEVVTTHTTNLWIIDCTFSADEAGTETTDYLIINVASTTGLVSGCRFATATNASATLNIAAGVLWVGNYTEAGLSTARPS